jgi:hypothetical protein
MKEDSPFGVAMKIRKKGVNEFLKSLKQINWFYFRVINNRVKEV